MVKSSTISQTEPPFTHGFRSMFGRRICRYYQWFHLSTIKGNRSYETIFLFRLIVSIAGLFSRGAIENEWSKICFTYSSRHLEHNSLLFVLPKPCPRTLLSHVCLPLDEFKQLRDFMFMGDIGSCPSSFRFLLFLK